MSQDVPAFQALPGATPQNSAFIDLYFDPSVKGYPRRSRVSLVINGYQLWLGFGQSVALAVPAGPVSIVVQQINQLLYSSTARLDFSVHVGQRVPVFYRASHFERNPGSLMFQRFEGLSPSERNDLNSMKIMFAVILGSMAVFAIFMGLVFWFLNSLGAS